MPIRRKLEEAVPILLRLVDEVTNGPESNTQLEEIKKYFFDEKRKDLFLHLKETEDDLLKNFTTLEEEIDNSKYAPVDSPRERSIKGKFRSIQGVVSEFEDLKLQSAKSPKKDQSEADQAKEISEQWSTLKVEHEILESSVLDRFRLSYDNITDHNVYDIHGKVEHTILGRDIKLCLLCFSVFPANSVIKKRPLIYWWLGEGLITDMDHGERIFGELIKKGFLIARYKPYKKEEQDKNPIVDSCTMHSWNRRMLISVAKRAKFFDFDDDTGLPANHGTNSRHMCLVKQRYLDKQTPPNGEPSQQDHTEQQQNSPDASTEHRLLTLFNVNEQYLNISHDWFSKEDKIVVLQLGRWKDSAKPRKEVENEDHREAENEDHIEVENEDFLKALGTKKHLKYLSLRGISRITEIPSAIHKLFNLEILDLRACHNLEKLPSDISSLKKLTHLDISECYLLESMPKGLEKLTSLQVLKGFVVATSKKGPGRLGDVTGLTKLRKLSIYIPSDAHIEEAELSKLKDLSTLRILSITWRGGGGEASTERSPRPTMDRKKSFLLKRDGQQAHSLDILKMKSLSFPEKLEKLDLWCIPCTTNPAWLNPDKFKSLKKLYIRGGQLNSLSFEGNNKWNVRILRLKYLVDLKVGKEQLRDNFPHLIYSETKNQAKGKEKDEHGGSSSSSSRS